MIKYNRFTYLFLFILATLFYACGDSAEDVSFGYDYKVPKYEVLTDSLIVEPLQTIEIKVRISDNEGLNKYVFSYGDWAVSKAEELNGMKEYLFEMSITIPADAKKEWEDTFTEKDGTVRSIVQTYHKLIMLVTDVNMNVTNVPVYIKVK